MRANPAATVHIFSIFTSFIGPLVYLRSYGKHDEFFVRNAKRAFDFQLTMALPGLAILIVKWFSPPLWLFGGLVAVFLPSVLLAVTLPWFAARRASRGKMFAYPAIRILGQRRGEE
jgi:uncharacterized Tic20 family protein